MNSPYILFIYDYLPISATFTHFPVVFEECREGNVWRHAGFLVPLTPDQGVEVQKEADEVTGYIHVDSRGMATRVFGGHYTNADLDLGKVEAAYADHVYRFCLLDDEGRKNSDWYGFSNNPEIL